MFRGSFEHTIDGKGRVSVPAKFRDVLAEMKRDDLAPTEDDSVMITNFMQNDVRCLDVYPMKAWEQVESELVKQSRIDPEARRIRSYYSGRASECPVDKQGRILIPPQLRNWANLTRDVVFVSDLDRFQIWDKDAWQKYISDTESDISRNPDKLAKIGI